MVKALSRHAIAVLVSLLSASLYACGGAPVEEGTDTGTGTREQEVTSSLSCTRNFAGDLDCTHTASAGTPPFTYFWHWTETHHWDGTVIASGWYTGTNVEQFYCPRAPSRENEFIWYLKIEVYAQDATGAISPVVYRGFPCSVNG